MKRFHVHVGVTELDRSIAFYNELFGKEPAVRKADYAKWMLDDPRVNFAISTRAAKGLDHLGIQVDSDEALIEIRDRLDAVDAPLGEERGTTCCYARSDKYWAKDPSGIAWETFRTLGEAKVYSAADAPRQETEPATASACCAPGCCA